MQLVSGDQTFGVKERYYDIRLGNERIRQKMSKKMGKRRGKRRNRTYWGRGEIECRE